ncbi:hypothetical protein [Streptomyces sp. NPDC056296]|uniref:hypothetical protein n=1 Tax=Streptomyces sp. NPDC056296 TaxID=3345775 RepID=UPI0035E06CE9
MTDKQHEADVARVEQQNSLTDVIREIDERPSGFVNKMMRSAVEATVEDTPFGSVVRGRTNFENYRLNDMIDLVEQTNPEDLTSSGEALYSARTAIAEAAGELKGHIERVHWVGESGDAFRKWGRSLVASTEGLSEYAAGAADQISAAAAGLTDVRTAMPERDGRAEQTSPQAFPKDEQVADNKEYAAAVKSEKNRQEAINQMNRLSSYYAVSREQLAKLPVPTFKSMPDVGVPEPSRGGIGWEPGLPPLSGVQGGGAGSLSGQRSAIVMEGPGQSQDAEGTAASPDSSALQAVYPDLPVGTTIDSVHTPTFPPGPAAAHSLPTLPPPSEGGLNGPFANGQATPVPPTRSGRAGGGPNGPRHPLPTQGRVASSDGRSGGTGPGRPVNQGPLNQGGRATAAGQPVVAKGGTSGPTSIPMRHGVSGGTPRANPAATPGAAGGPVTGAGRASGVVGGRPGTVPGAAARSGPRFPRGAVVGAETTTNTQPVRGRNGQGGTAGNTAVSPTQPRIAGTPTGRISAAHGQRNGMTSGGAGLVRGPGGRGRPRDELTEEGTQRPDYLVEDEETHLPTTPRRDVPPIVN